jgi:hypothetical protein
MSLLDDVEDESVVVGGTSAIVRTDGIAWQNCSSFDDENKT